MLRRHLNFRQISHRFTSNVFLCNFFFQTSELSVVQKDAFYVCVEDSDFCF